MIPRENGFLGGALIYLFVHLFTFLGWMVEVIFLSEACRKSSDYRRKVDAGRGSNQQQDLEAGHSHGLHARVSELGDEREGRRLRVCLQSGRDTGG